MEEVASALLANFSVFFSAQNENDRRCATDAIQELEQNPGTVIAALTIIERCQGDQSTGARQMAAIVAGHVLKAFNGGYTPEQLAEIKSLFCQMIRTEPNGLVRNNICEAAAIIAGDYNASVLTWPELIPFATELISVPGFFSTGVYILSLIFSLIPNDMLREMLGSLVDVSLAGMRSEVVEDRIAGIKLLDPILWRVDEAIPPEYMKITITALQETMNMAFRTYQNDNECTLLARSIEDLIRKQPGTIYIYSELFTKQALEIVADASIRSDLRVIAYDIIKDGSTILMDIDNDNAESVIVYLNVFMQLAMGLCREDYTNPIFEFPMQFLHNAGATIENDTVFRYIWTICNEMMTVGDVPARVMVLFLLRCIVESQEDAFRENVKDISAFVVAVGECDDEYVIKYACDVIQEMTEYVPDVIHLVANDIVVYLMKRVQFYGPLSVLDRVIGACEHAPRPIGELMTAMLEVLTKGNAMQQEFILEAIASCLETTDESIAEMHPTLMGLLGTAVESDYMKPGVMRCFARMISTAPELMKDEVPKIIPFIMASLSCGNAAMAYRGLECLESIVEHLCLSLTPVMGPVVEAVVALIQQNPPSDDCDDSDDSDTSDMFFKGLRCLAVLLKFMPTQMTQLVPVVLGIFNHLIHTSKVLFPLPVYCIVSILAEPMKQLGVGDFVPIIQALLMNIRNVQDKSHIIEAFYTLRDILRTFGPEMISSADMVGTIHGNIIRPFTGADPTSYTMCETSLCPDVKLIRPLFGALNQFIRVLGADVVPFIPDIYQAVSSCFSNGCNIFRGFPLEVNAKLCAIAKSPELFAHTLENSITIVKSVNNHIAQTACLNGLRDLLNTNKEAFAGQGELFAGIESMIRECADGTIDHKSIKYSAIALWCTFIMELGITPAPEMLTLVLEELPPPFDSELIPPTAIFTAFAMMRWAEIASPRLPSIAATVLASDHYLIGMIPAEIVTALGTAIAPMPEETLTELVHHHQGRLVKLMSVLERFK